MLPKQDMPLESEIHKHEQGSFAEFGTDMLCGDEVTVNGHDMAGEKHWLMKSSEGEV